MKGFTEKIRELWNRNPWVSATAVLLAVIVCGISALAVMGSNKDYAVPGSHLVIIREGMSTADIAELLHEKKLVRNPAAFRLEARFKGLAEKLQAGPYQLRGGMTNSEIADVISKGRIKLVTFAVPEGYTVVRTARKMEEEGLGKAENFIAAAKSYAPYPYMQSDNPDVLFKAEGFIYPATYKFPVGASEKEMLEMMVNTFQNEMRTSGVLKEAEDKNVSMRDVVNIAAMVEQEAVYAEEQPRIAGVFLKRLEIGMPIQSDTTIQYILGTQKEIITFADLKIQNPYNTYQNYGLPPGPIGSPGLSAIRAVLEPEDTDYLYFVAERDGHHRFSKTYKEHLQAIQDIDGGN